MGCDTVRAVEVGVDMYKGLCKASGDCDANVLITKDKTNVESGPLGRLCEKKLHGSVSFV